MNDQLKNALDDIVAEPLESSGFERETRRGGAGPGPALLATSDFYNQLTEYAEKHSIAGLATPQPKLHAVEASPSMGHVMHWISELSNRRGPHQRRLGSFQGTDFDQLRIEERDATVRALQEDDPWIAISDLFAWQDEWRFNFGIFSYFLTNERIVSETTRELQSLFHGAIKELSIEGRRDRISTFWEGLKLRGRNLYSSVVHQVLRRRFRGAFLWGRTERERD